MAVLRVESPGLQSSLQDLGRPGYAHLGISASGAADPLALRLGNRLLGNDDNAAGLEMTLLGGTFLAEQALAVAVAGADFGARLDDRPIDPWTRLTVPAGGRLEFGAARSGARAYLCVAGGFDLPPTLGSVSTHLTSGLGGLGRALRPGDRLPTRGDAGGRAAPGFRIDRDWVAAQYAAAPFRVTCGPQADWFTPAGRDLFAAAAYSVREQSNRMGLRLDGPPIPRQRAGELLTEGVSLGAIQVPEDGRPILLFVEHQTTGGYPKIANIASVDLHRVGQLRPRDPVTFRWTRLEEARRLLLDMEAGLGRRLPDLNADVGERPGALADGSEAALIALLDSVNVACGGHAGDDASMARVVALAARHGVAVGAHPGYPDRAGFGRRPLPMSAAEITACVRDQVARLARVAAAQGVPLRHVKPHGALYNQAAADPAVAEAIARGVEEWRGRIRLVGLAGSVMLDCWRRLGFEVAAEAFVDRRYEADGRLRARHHPDALVTDPGEAADQAAAILRGELRAVDGRPVRLSADTLCLHSDTPGALETARAVRERLAGRGGWTGPEMSE